MSVPSLLNVTFKNVANYRNITTYYNSIPESTSEQVYHILYDKSTNRYHFFDINNIKLNDPTNIIFKMLLQYAHIVISNMKKEIKQVVESGNYVIKVMTRNLGSTGTKPGQTLHRNMATFHNIPVFNGYKSFVQTLFFPKTGVNQNGRVISNNALPRTYYIPKYSITPSGTYKKTAFKTVSKGVSQVHVRETNYTSTSRNANSVQGKAGKIMQFLSPIGYHSAEQITMPHTRSIVLSHLYISPQLYNNFFTSLGIPLSKKANTQTTNPTYYVQRRQKSALANLLRGYPINRVKLNNITIKNLNKLKNYGIVLNNNKLTFINNGISKLIPNSAKPFLNQLLHSAM